MPEQLADDLKAHKECILELVGALSVCFFIMRNEAVLIQRYCRHSALALENGARDAQDRAAEALSPIKATFYKEADNA